VPSDLTTAAGALACRPRATPAPTSTPERRVSLAGGLLACRLEAHPRDHAFRPGLKDPSASRSRLARCCRVGNNAHSRAVSSTDCIRSARYGRATLRVRRSWALRIQSSAFCATYTLALCDDLGTG
jgi:hypothetical protein